MAKIFGIQSKGLVSKLSDSEEAHLLRLQDSLQTIPVGAESLKISLLNLSVMASDFELMETHRIELPDDLQSLRFKIEALQSAVSPQDHLFRIFELIQSLEDWTIQFDSPRVFGKQRKSSLLNKILEQIREEFLLKMTSLLEELRENLKTLRQSGKRLDQKPTEKPQQEQGVLQQIKDVIAKPESDLIIPNKKVHKNNLRELIREFLTHLHQLPNSEIQSHLKWLNLVEEEVQSAKARCLEVDRDFFSHWATEMKKSDLLEALLDSYDQKIYQTNQRNDLSEDEKLKRVKLWKTLQQFEVERLKGVQENLED